MKLPCDIPGDAEFFRAFARLEYALKEIGYFQKGRSDAAEPAREKFGKSIEGDLIKDGQGDPDIELLIKEPPRRQIVKGNKLCWQKLRPARNNQELLRAVRTVRNNLFHGGKTPYAPINDHMRDERLIHASMKTLKNLLEQCTDLKTKFEAD
jgi:hypothetical protein